MMRLTLSPRAHADLDEIWDYSAEKWNAERADSYISEIWKTVELIADEPGLGRSCDEIREGYFKFPSGSHLIFYKKTNENIEIVRVLHQWMDIDNHL
jgi:toxin ParE1/3/4